MKSHTITFREQDKKNFDAIASGEKLFETRAGTEKYMAIEVGDEIVFECTGETCSKTVARKCHWGSVEEMVQEVPLKSIMPWVETVEEAKAAYASFPGYEEKNRDFGIVGFELE